MQVRGLILDQGREFYDVQVVDLNKDGRLDVLVTVVSSNGGSVEVWEPTQGNFRFELLSTMFYICSLVHVKW